MKQTQRKMHPCFALFSASVPEQKYTIAFPKTLVHTMASCFSVFRLTGAPIVQIFQNSHNNDFIDTTNMWAAPLEKQMHIFFSVSDPNTYYLSSRSVFRGNMSWAKSAKGIELDKWGNDAFHIINSNTRSLVGNFTSNICGPDKYDDLVKEQTWTYLLQTTQPKRKREHSLFSHILLPPSPSEARGKQHAASNCQELSTLLFIFNSSYCFGWWGSKFPTPGFDLDLLKSFSAL